MSARHALALAPALLALLLAACGDSGTPDARQTAPDVLPQAAPLITEQSTARAGDQRIGAAVLVLSLPGPVLQLERPALVRVQLSGRVLQSAHYGAAAVVSIALAEPTATAPSSLPATLLPLSPPEAVPLAYQVWLQLPAGAAPLVARITVRALNADGTPTSALAQSTAELHWAVEVQP